LILIADEQAVVRKGLRTLLESQTSFKVVAEAKNGSEAVAKAGQFGPDLVILNICLPELSGIDAARLILKKAPETRILFFANDDRQKAATMALRTGALGHVLISDPERDLIEVVHAVLNAGVFTSSGASGVVGDSLRQPSESASHSQLSPRESQILQLLAEGKSNKQIAVTLGLSTRTVENHRARIMAKLGFRSLAEIVLYAIRNGIVKA
jgi:DNA-binding NarL/FixJ family response regulator